MSSTSTLTAKIQSWTRDSFELLDYDATDVTKTVLKAKQNCFLVRVDGIPKFVGDPSSESLSQLKILSRLALHNGFYSLAPVTSLNDRALSRDQYEKLWLVVRYLKSKGSQSGYFLGEDDVIRVGRCKFRVKELKSSGGSENEPFSLCDMLSGNDNESSEEGAAETCRAFALPCRICLSELYDVDNPLISPCKCGGTMKYIHLKCLQQCLMSKLTSKSSDCVLSFSWKKLGCDLCKKTYPYKLILQGRTIELLDIPKPPGHYLILEMLCKDKNSQKGLHLIHMSNKSSIRIGRAQDCELRITDISVSRNHAKLSFVNGKFILEDTGGKFGTLVQIKRPVLIDDKAEITVQSGRSLISYSLKMPWTLIPACFRGGSNQLEGNFSSRNMPILPINTGIPVSISDPYRILAYAGMPVKQCEKYNKNKNLLYAHNQLGANSSYEFEDNESIEEAEEVEIANAEQLNEEELCEETNRFEVTSFK